MKKIYGLDVYPNGHWGNVVTLTEKQIIFYRDRKSECMADIASRTKKLSRAIMEIDYGKMDFDAIMAEMQKCIAIMRIHDTPLELYKSLSYASKYLCFDKNYERIA